MTREEWKLHRRDQRRRIRNAPKAPGFEPGLLYTLKSYYRT
jgi:hypothetical protein